MIKEIDPNKEQTSQPKNVLSKFAHIAKFQGSIPKRKYNMRQISKHNISFFRPS